MNKQKAEWETFKEMGFEEDQIYWLVNRPLGGSEMPERNKTPYKPQSGSKKLIFRSFFR
jgi:hypothetical protein